jgi:DNA-binding NarL/FixJ family response regulator
MVLAVVDDLLLGSKIRAAARESGRVLAFSRDPELVLADIRARRPALVIVDLDRSALDPMGVIREIKSSPDLAAMRVVGFVSHVHADRIRDARAAGIDTVLARSAFFTSLPEILAAAPEGDTPPSTGGGSAPAS